MIPRRLNPGDDFNQRLIYALCSNARADEISGDLYTRIYFKAEPILNDEVDDYSLKHGRCRADTFASLPTGIEPGVYSLETSFESEQLDFSRTESFVVQ